MSNDSEIDPSLQALLDAFNNGLIAPIKELVREYRLYYDEYGDITCRSDSNWNHPESGNYVVCDEHTYNNFHLYTIILGKLELKPTDPFSRIQIKLSDDDGLKQFKVVATHPAIIVETEEEFNQVNYYDREYR